MMQGKEALKSGRDVSATPIVFCLTLVETVGCVMFAAMPTYTDHLVAFYDVLGFSNFVRLHPDADAIHNLYSRITESASVPDEMTESLGQRHVQFSDTIIRTTPIIDPAGLPNRDGIFFYELLDALHLQMELIWSESILVRGAITFGRVYHAEGEIFGPAIIRAHELESEIAIFPRVIIDPVLFKTFEKTPMLRAQHHDLATDREYLLGLLTCGDDGVWFVDYLAAAASEADDPDTYPEFLGKHKEMILRELSGQTMLTRVKQKYTWLAHYHNRTVDSLSESFWEHYRLVKDDLLISSAEAPLLYIP